MRGMTLALGLCALVGLTTTAQSATGTLAGIVCDSAGTPLAGARIALARDGMPAAATISDSRGAFTFARLPAARYDVTATRAGFAAFTTHAVVEAGRSHRLTIVLSALAPAPLSAPLAQSARETRAADAAVPAGVVGGVVGGIVGGVVGGIPAAPGPAMDARRAPRPEWNTEGYDRIDDNPFRRVATDPLSTFSIDVDTASYANVRRFLNAGALPPPDAVRIEELINYFHFDYAMPASDVPFSVTTELAACPWNPAHRLALVGLQARPIDVAHVPPRNLVFLIDVSGSMDSPDKLPLVRTALRMLADTLTPRDRIAIVVYAGASGLALPATSGAHKETIQAAIASLEPGGSTNGAAGITLAYQIAQEHFVRDGINRVILATDGDFNVGVTSQGELTRLIEEKRTTGVFLSVLGVGTGNVKDSTMEKLADRGNGNYAYLDTLHEARRVLLSEGGATLVTVAKDVKIQVEFNPALVGSYRLIGYENRLLASQDFNDDRKDAGEMGAGHTVTALYELVPPGEESGAPAVDPLKYQRPAAPGGQHPDEVMTVKLRYKAPGGDTSRLLSVAVKNRPTELPANLGFAAAVAEFGLLLRGSDYAGSSSHASAAALARRFRGADPEGYRAEFIRLVELAGSLKTLTAR